jgi:antitoxin (DNA-binding transcriptional repressor) of toxin-antitoxin stability system
MKTVTIHDAKTNLSKYIATAKMGQKVYIGGFGKPEVVLTKVSKLEDGHIFKRTFLVAKGKVVAGPDSFSEKTDQDISKLMLND